MKLETTAANYPYAIGRFVSGRLTLPPRVQNVVENDRVIVTGSAIADGWRSYLIAPSKVDVIIRRGVRATWKQKEIAERDFDAAMIWSLFEVGMVVQMTVKDNCVRFPSDLIERNYRQVWFLPHRAYTVVTTSKKEVDTFCRAQKVSAAAQC